MIDEFLASREEIHDRLHALVTSGKQLFIAATGAMGGLSETLWQVPGASSLLLEYRFCYAQESLVDFLGFKPGKFCSVDTANFMAAQAYHKGCELAIRRGIKEPDVVGVGVSASVATNRHRRGADEAWIAVRTRDAFIQFWAPFASCDADATLGERERRRSEQGNLTDAMTLNLILHAAGLPQMRFVCERDMSRGLIKSPTDASCAIEIVPEPVFDMRQHVYGYGTLYGHTFDPNPKFDEKNGDSLEPLVHEPCILFSGSFNPLHYGHIAVARTVEKMTGRRVIFEITNIHPDKSVVSEEELIRRANQFTAFAPVVLTDGASFYIDKARLYPGIPFIVGADVMKKILTESYYGGFQKMIEVLQEFRRLHTVFYVTGRNVDGVFLTRDLVPVPKQFDDLFIGVSGREDISSTQLREAAQVK